MEKMRILQTRPIHEQKQMLHDLINNPEEHRKFLAILQQYVEEKEKEDQRRVEELIEEFNKTTKSEEEFLGSKKGKREKGNETYGEDGNGRLGICQIMADLDSDEELDKEITLEDEDIEDREMVEGEQTSKDQNTTVKEQQRVNPTLKHHNFRTIENTKMAEADKDKEEEVTIISLSEEEETGERKEVPKSAKRKGRNEGKDKKAERGGGDKDIRARGKSRKGDKESQ